MNTLRNTTWKIGSVFKLETKQSIKRIEATLKSYKDTGKEVRKQQGVGEKNTQRK